MAAAEAEEAVAASTGWFSGFGAGNWALDQEYVLGMSRTLQKIEMWPYFDIAHYILAMVSVRADLGQNALTFARQHPFSCWLSCMMMSFAGTILANFLLGDPIVEAFKNNGDITAATIIWYAIFYSPFDICYKSVQLFPLKLPLSLLKEVQRANKVLGGVVHAKRLHPRSILVQALVGIAKGAGGGVVKIFEQLIRGSWRPGHHEILRPSFTTKSCVIIAVVFTIHRNSSLIALPHDALYIGATGFLVYFKLTALLFNVTDPLAPLENLFCSVFLGGIWDAFNRAIDDTKEEAAASRKTKNLDAFDVDADKLKLSKKEAKKTK